MYRLTGRRDVGGDRDQRSAAARPVIWDVPARPGDAEHDHRRRCRDSAPRTCGAARSPPAGARDLDEHQRQPAATALPDIPVNALVIDPVAPNTYYIATDVGRLPDHERGRHVDAVHRRPAELRRLRHASCTRRRGCCGPGRTAAGCGSASSTSRRCRTSICTSAITSWTTGRISPTPMTPGGVRRSAAARDAERPAVVVAVRGHQGRRARGHAAELPDAGGGGGLRRRTKASCSTATRSAAA